MFPLDEWHDYFRAFALVINISAFYILVQRYRKHKHRWNTKTLDFWYAMTMWTLAGAVFSAQGVALDRPFTPGFVFLVFATLTTAKALLTRGTWGDHEPSHVR